MVQATINLKNAADIMNNLQKLNLKNVVILKKCGAWSIIGGEYLDVKLDMHLFNTLACLGKIKIRGSVDDNIFYKLTKTGFDVDASHYKHLLRLLHDKKFPAVIDLRIYLERFGYDVRCQNFDNVPPAHRCLCISKNNFNLTIPYYTKITDLLNKDGLFKVLCQIVCVLYFDKNIYPYSVSASAPIHSVLRREWQRKFDFVANKVLEWTKRQVV